MLFLEQMLSVPLFLKCAEPENEYKQLAGKGVISFFRSVFLRPQETSNIVTGSLAGIHLGLERRLGLLSTCLHVFPMERRPRPSSRRQRRTQPNPAPELG